MRRRTLAAALALVLVPTAAHACTPIMSVGFLGLMAGYLVWLVLTLCLSLAWEPSRKGALTWGVLVPLGLFGFAVPMFGASFLLPAVLVMVAFPMHLAVEFFSYLFVFREDPRRGLALFYYGAPLAVILGLGIWAKYALYGPGGGLRSFVWNYTEGGGYFFMGLWLLVGLAVLVFRPRRPTESAS